MKRNVTELKIIVMEFERNVAAIGTTFICTARFIWELCQNKLTSVTYVVTIE